MTRFEKPSLLLMTALAVLSLTACAGAPALRPATANFKPLSPDVAALTAAANPGNGKPLICAIGKGTARFGSDWKDFSTTEFILPGTDRVDITLESQHGGGTSRIIAYYDAAGQKMIFCPYVTNADPDQRIPCASIYALEDDLTVGIKRTFDVPDAVRNADITCAYNRDALKKL